MRDLENASWMYLKTALFLVLLLSSCARVLLKAATWPTAGLLFVIVWTSARLYYFAFYVIERYIDPTYRFSGLWSAMRYLIRVAKDGSQPGDADSES